VKHFRFVLAAMLTLKLAGSAQTAGSAQMTGSGQKTDSAHETVTVQTTPDPSRVLQTTGERLLTDLKRVPRYTFASQATRFRMDYRYARRGERREIIIGGAAL
jgi:hypothetical protein